MGSIKDVKDLFKEDVEEKISEVKKFMNKEKGNLDRHTLRSEARIDSYRAELVMLGALLEHIPARQPEIFEYEKDEEAEENTVEAEENAEPVESSE